MDAAQTTVSDAQYWRQKGRCTYCHEQDAYTMMGRSYCGECARKNRDAKREVYPIRSAEINLRDRTAYQERKEKRLCVKCAKPLEPGNNRVRCLACTRKLSIHDKLAVLDKPLRGDNGVCWMCNKREKLPDKRCCAVCYETLRGNMLKAQAESTRKRKLRCGND